MRTHTILMSLVCACVLALAGAARADDTFGRPSEKSPSMLSYGFKGMGTGALVGLSAGYIVARRHDEGSSDDWRAIGLGAGIGALAGTGVGLGLGAADLAARHPGVGGVVLRDTLYGVTLGGLAGVLGGGISAIAQSEPEHAAFGAAVGGLSGAGIGMIIGFIEGPRLVKSPEHNAMRIRPTVAHAARDIDNRRVWTLGAVGRF
jgi:hypothetical protein